MQCGRYPELKLDSAGAWPYSTTIINPIVSVYSWVIRLFQEQNGKVSFRVCVYECVGEFCVDRQEVYVYVRV